MSKKSETTAEMPKVELATKDYVDARNSDTEGRIERAFRQQTDYFNTKFDMTNSRIDTLSKWMFGLFVTMTITIIAAIISQ